MGVEQLKRKIQSEIGSRKVQGRGRNLCNMKAAGRILSGRILSGEFPHGKGGQALHGAGVSREPLDVTLGALGW